MPIRNMISVPIAEVKALREKVQDSIDEGKSQYPAMTFEQGIAEAIDWLFGDQDEKPFDE